MAADVRFGYLEASDDDIACVFSELGLSDWLEQLPDGLHSSVGERGESLSVGERQLVTIARAYIADPDLLVLDEAPSAVDPATEGSSSAARTASSWHRTGRTPGCTPPGSPTPVEARGG